MAPGTVSQPAPPSSSGSARGQRRRGRPTPRYATAKPAVSVAGSRGDPLQTEEKLEDLRQRYQLLDGDRKAYMESSRMTINQNKEMIQALKDENVKLKASLVDIHDANQVRPGAREIQMTATGRVPLSQYKKVEEDKNTRRRNLDNLRDIRVQRKAEMEQLADELAILQSTVSQGNAQGESAHQREIRVLENKLDKAMIKYNESQSIRKTYETIVERLQKEEVGFSNQLAQIEAALKSKDTERAELELLANDADHANAVAKAELAAVQRQVEEERERREAELSQKRSLVAARAEVAERTEKREKMRRELSHENGDDESPNRRRNGNWMGKGGGALQQQQEMDKITTYEEAFRRIKDATGLSDVDEIIAKFLSQEDTNSNLQAMQREAESRIELLTEEKAHAKLAVEEIKYTATGSVGSRRIVDEFQGQLADAERQRQEIQLKYERTQKLYVNVRAGVDHLTDKLSAIKFDTSSAQPVSDDPVAVALANAEEKLTKTLEAVEEFEAERKREAEQAKVSSALGAFGGMGAMVAAKVDAEKDSEKKDGSAAATGTSAGATGKDAEIVPGAVSQSNLNVRVRPVVNPADDDSDSDDDDDDDGAVLDRTAMKAQAVGLVEKQTRKSKKKKRGGQ